MEIDVVSSIDALAGIKEAWEGLDRDDPAGEFYTSFVASHAWCAAFAALVRVAATGRALCRPVPQ